MLVRCFVITPLVKQLPAQLASISTLLWDILQYLLVFGYSWPPTVGFSWTIAHTVNAKGTMVWFVCSVITVVVSESNLYTTSVITIMSYEDIPAFWKWPQIQKPRTDVVIP